MRQSQAIASSSAPPAAAPFTTPITGSGQSATAATAAPRRRSPARMRSHGVAAVAAEVEPGREVAVALAAQQDRPGGRRRGVE